MYLSYLTDEIVHDFDGALRIGSEWGLRHAEIRLVDGVNVLDLTDSQIARARSLLRDYGLRVSAVATPFFKCALPGEGTSRGGPRHGAQDRTFDEFVGLLPRGVEIAQAFGTSAMRIFSFWRVEDTDFWPALDRAVEASLVACAGTGVTPCLENEGACFVATSADMAEAARRFSGTGLTFIWDPGNSSRCPTTAPQ